MGRRAGDDDALRLEQGQELLAGPGTASSASASSVVASSTRASTATGEPSAVTISGLQSALTMRGSASAAADRASRTAASCSRSTAASPRNAPSSAWVSRSSIISAASTARDRDQAERRRRPRPRPGSHRRPSITVMPNCGSRCRPAISSRLPFTIGATSRWTSPSSGRAAASSSAAAAADRVVVAEAEPDEPPLGLVGDGVTAELHDDGMAELARRQRRPRSTVSTTRSPGHGQAVGCEEGLGVGLGERGHGGRP